MEILKNKIKYGESYINWTNCYKYLGIKITNNGCITAITQKLGNKAWKVVIAIKICF